MKNMNKKDFLKKDLEEKRPHMNKKGGEKLLSIWWVFVLIVIGGGIFIGVLIYYSVEINVNEVEADVLAERILNCINDNGYLSNEVFEPNFDIFQKCNLNPNLFGKSSYYYFNISIYDDNGIIFNTTKGDYSFEKDCLIQEKVTANNFPKCSRKVDNIFYENKNLKIVILAGANQQGKSV